MSLTEEVDASDLPQLSYYRDERCQEFEEILGNTSEYADCVVKRLRQSEEFPEWGDPFSIHSSEGDVLVWIYDWELDALSESELLAFIPVRRKRGEISEATVPLQFGGGFAAFFGVCMIVAQIILSLIGMVIPIEILFIPGMLLIFIGWIVLSLGSRRDRVRKTELDIEVARKNPAFLDALRKLASLTDTKNKAIAEYSQRLGVIERDSI